MGNVKFGVAPDGTRGVVLEFEDEDEEDEWRMQSRRERLKRPRLVEEDE